jgi:anion-transporting  ArsA/GET3 family ATPase
MPRPQEEARQLFRNPDTTEFVIVTIPTIMAVSESGRLAQSLREEGVPLHTLVVNQVRLAGRGLPAASCQLGWQGCRGAAGQGRLARCGPCGTVMVRHAPSAAAARLAAGAPVGSWEGASRERGWLPGWDGRPGRDPPMRWSLLAALLAGARCWLPSTPGWLLRSRGTAAASRLPRASQPLPAHRPRAQVVAEGATQQLLKMRRQDQQRAMQLLRDDPGLAGLQLVEGPLLDLEVRGLPALQYFGGVVWK